MAPPDDCRLVTAGQGAAARQKGTALAHISGSRIVAAGMLAAWLLPAGQASAQPAAETGCAQCHDALPEDTQSAPARLFRDDVHRARGFTCVDCHGGDPTATDKDRAKASATGYRGRPSAAAIVATCARCHSDAEFMRRYAPRQRVDQEAEYATSVHGKRLAEGDARVATCASCHGAHGIRQVSDGRAPVFPGNVAGTCATCHASESYMQGYSGPDGSPLPTTQHAEYVKSVHYGALMTRNDLSAPTCNDCHGNHGAAPPGVGSVANVCGTCHAVFAERFDRTTHAEIFDRGCAECHSNHAVFEADDAMLGATEPGICATCHSADDAGFIAARTMRASIDRLRSAIDANATLIARVRNAGMDVSDEELAMNEAQTRLTLARTEVHSFSPAAVDPVVLDGLKILEGVGIAGEEALAELRFRRRGLAASLFAILVLVVAIALKIRDIERRQGLPSNPR